VGEVVGVCPEGDSRRVGIAAPSALAPFLSVKGSVTVDGASLTINEVADQPDGTTHFALNVIPHTAAQTTLGELATGSEVNIEIDVLARYLGRMMELRR
jgi:riboflavin synthase